MSDPGARWVSLAVHEGGEELLVSGFDVAPPLGRAIIQELLRSGRIPPAAPMPGRGAMIAVIRRLWVGTERRSEGTYL